MEYTVYSTLINTTFLDLQLKSFDKFLTMPSKEGGEKNVVNFVVINNGRNDNEANHIFSYCNERGIECIRPTHNKFDRVGTSHQESLNWIFRNIVPNKNSTCDIIVDFDIFPITKPSVVTRKLDYYMCGLKQGSEEITYLWPGLIVFNGPIFRMYGLYKSVDFRGAMIHAETNDFFICDEEHGFTWDEYWRKFNAGYKPFDSGAMLHFLIKDSHLEPDEYSLNLDVGNKIPKSIQHLHDPAFKFWIIDNAWLHFGRGSNWDSSDQSYFTRKVAFLNYWMNEVL